MPRPKLHLTLKDKQKFSFGFLDFWGDESKELIQALNILLSLGGPSKFCCPCDGVVNLTNEMVMCPTFIACEKTEL